MIIKQDTNQRSLMQRIESSSFAKLAGIFILSASVSAYGIYHYQRVNAPRRAAEILAGQVPMEVISSGVNGRSELNVRGLVFDINRRTETNPKDYVEKVIKNSNRAAGLKLVEGQKLSSIPVKLRRDFDFFCFVGKDKKIRGYVLNNDEGRTRVTSVEISLEKLVGFKMGGEGRVNSSDVRSDFLQIMPWEPEFYLKNDIESGFGLYSCKAHVSDADLLYSSTKDKLSSAGWRMEGWQMPETDSSDMSDKFLVASKDSTLCHIIFTESGNDLHVTYRFSGARGAIVAN
ncbi:MAG TPA: hypothetical protein PK821_07480 [Victivallales bacterium]|nr:hypothetical protein [Victivallales bacterium]